MKFPVVFFLVSWLLSSTLEPLPNLPGPPINVPDGFRVERLLAPMEEGMGSWVSLAHVEGNRFAASDQYGKIYWVDIPSVGQEGEVQVTPLEVDGLGKAQGLLWAYNSLYVMVNDGQIENSGLYRVRDMDGNGTLDSAQHLQHLRGRGEHGPHGAVLGPDGLIYVIAGNHTDLPERSTSILSGWEEDRLFSTIKDPNGHARNRKAPGGWIARTDSIGSFWEVYASGFRNPYDLAFNAAGQLFTFDSDMEWDLGLPWYRPIRVCHVTSGAEFGWRTGSGKWPAYYPDNLPGILDIGQGSPTGVISAEGLSFPAPFNQGLFVCDWSFGTMYHVALESNGSTYRGRREEFLSGVPLPLTDVAMGGDGAMYFTTGGRRLESGLYRVWYEGSIPPGVESAVAPEIEIRQRLEAYHSDTVTPDQDFIWDQLGSADRFIRFSARVAIERHGTGPWADRLAGETDPWRLMMMGVAMARVGEAEQQQRIFDQLSSMDVGALDTEQQLALVRAQGLLLIRNAELSSDPLTGQWIGAFPSAVPALKEELAFLFTDTHDSQWLPKVLEAWSQAPDAAEGLIIADSVARRSQQYGRAVMNLRKRTPAAHKIALMYAMSHYQRGWTPEMRESYFVGFNSLWDREGGRSYRGYILGILEKALKQVPESQRATYRELAGANLGEFGSSVLANLPVPEGPGQNWTVDKVEAVMDSRDMVANYDNGEKMFDAALCRSCHSIQGRGSSLGPELSQLGTRFSIKDMAVALVDPNAAISDQYAVSDITLIDQTVVTGKVLKEEQDTLHVMINPLAPDYQRKIPRSEVVSEAPSPRSWMFPGMLNRLNEQEVYDLVTFLVAGGNEDHQAYQ